MSAHENLRDIVRQVALASPNAEAMVLDGRRWTYADLDAATDALARALIAAGVNHGDRVATLSTPHPDFLVAFLATAQIGAIWLGLNPRYRPAELSYVLGDAEPVVLLARTLIEDRDYRQDFAALAAACPSLKARVTLNADPLFDGAMSYESFLAKGEATSPALLAAREAAAGGRDACMIVYTSGSTGSPKGALLHHQGICDFSRAQNRLWPVSPQRIVNYFPVNHVGCVIDVTLPTLAAAGAVIFLEQFDAAEVMRLTERESCTMWGSVPSVLQMQLALPEFAAYDLSKLQLVLWEGAACPAEVLDRLLELGPPLATNYGMTETTSAMIAVAPTRDRDILANSVGLPFEGVEIRLVKADGTDAGEGEAGEVWARSAYNMLGYWRREAATAETLTPDGWLRTGDTAVRRPDGRYRIVGRIKEMYKSGGYNVYPREVEDALEAHGDVALAAVVAIRDPLWDEVGVAYVIASPGTTVATLEAHCRSRLANYKIPKRFVLRPELPLLPIGKVDKIALKKEAAEAFEGAS
jgi:acyl-CoA synthetase (AMP-forming)/AMP-acid ligase II